MYAEAVFGHSYFYNFCGSASTFYDNEIFFDLWEFQLVL